MIAKRILSASLLAVILPAVVVGAAPLPTELTTEQQTQVSQNCREVQTNLRMLQKNDTVLRINRGRLYDLTLRQTGAFVARLELHKVNAQSVKDQDTVMRATFKQFIFNYDSYADSLDAAIASDCSSKPQDFYRLLFEAGAKRQAVATDVAVMKQQLQAYVSEVRKLEASQPSSGGTQ